MYLAPEGSTFITQDPFTILKNELTQLPDNALYVICGDFNSRTITQPDYEPSSVHGNDEDLVNILPPNILNEFGNTNFMADNRILQRYSMDKCKPSEYGLQLLELCKIANLLILNGCVGSDKGMGEYTRMDTTGNSVVDYVINSFKAFPLFGRFAVQTKLPESDHRPVVFCINCVSNGKYKDCVWGRCLYKSTWKNKEYLRSKDNAKTDMMYQDIYNCICQNTKNEDVLPIMSSLQPNYCLKSISKRWTNMQDASG